MAATDLHQGAPAGDFVSIETQIAKPKGAGIERNEDIVWSCDVLVAFWDEESKGTAFTIQIAQKSGKNIYVEILQFRCVTLGGSDTCQ